MKASTFCQPALTCYETQGQYIEDITRCRAYFSVQYCTLCAVLIEKCAVLNMKLCSIEI